MLRVRHNDAERLLEAERFESVGDVVEACLAEVNDALGGPALIENLCVDGRLLEDVDIGQLRRMSLERVTEIELRSRTHREVALASLESAGSYLESVVHSTRSVVDQLRTGRVDSANTLYTSVLDALQIVIFTLAAAGRELGAAGAALVDAEVEAEPVVSELLDAQEARDWIRIADGLEHELLPLLTDWAGRTRDALTPSQAGH